VEERPHYQIWHTRHRSILNAMARLMAGIAAYTIELLKISAIRLLSGSNRLTEIQQMGLVD
jgi:hypothetical protein